ncbi:MAG TPA: hypothetical protein DDY39_18450 [Nitrospira sp.]|nr:hypothetical protein [Nitrospira sp.]
MNHRKPTRLFRLATIVLAFRTNRYIFYPYLAWRSNLIPYILTCRQNNHATDLLTIMLLSWPILMPARDGTGRKAGHGRTVVSKPLPAVQPLAPL